MTDPNWYLEQVATADTPSLEETCHDELDYDDNQDLYDDPLR